MQPVDAVENRHQHPAPRRRRAARAAAICGALVGAALVVAGCGGGSSSSPGVANVASTTASSTSAAASSSAAAAAGGAPAGGGAVGDGGQVSSGAPPSGGSFAQVSNGSPSELLKFSACMRANGVPDFPDPNAQGVIEGNSADFNTQSAAFQKASSECRKYSRSAPPSSGQLQSFASQVLVYSACIRSHGEPDFPDPQVSVYSNRVTVRLTTRPGSALDPNSPIFQKAEKDCAADQPRPDGKTPPHLPPLPAGG